MTDLFSNKPEDLCAMADEQIAFLKAELARFDASQQPTYSRLIAEAQQARDDRDLDAYDDYSREASKYRARWQDARQPYIQQIQRIAMLRDEIDPPKITFTWAEGVFAGVAPLPGPPR